MTRGWLGAALVVARITTVRLRRGRALWLGTGIAALPVLLALAMQPGEGEEAAFALVHLVLCVLSALFVASGIGEDIEDRTVTYLWSRAVPREAILVGKLLVLAPVVVALVLASWSVAAVALTGAAPSPQVLAGLGLGALATSTLAAGIATLVPKHGMALTVCYLLFVDLILGAMPFSLANIAITHHARELGKTGALGGVAWIAGMIALWLAIGVWRIRRLEA